MERHTNRFEPVIGYSCLRVRPYTMSLAVTLRCRVASSGRVTYSRPSKSTTHFTTKRCVASAKVGGRTAVAIANGATAGPTRPPALLSAAPRHLQMCMPLSFAALQHPIRCRHQLMTLTRPERPSSQACHSHSSKGVMQQPRNHDAAPDCVFVQMGGSTGPI
jgi:hypothetical protein